MDANKPTTEACRLMRIREVLHLCGFSRATLYNQIKLHTFPAPVKLSARSVGWVQEDVMQWMAARIAQRGPAYRAHARIASQETKKTKIIKPEPEHQAQDELE